MSEAIRELLAEHFVVWRERTSGPIGEWACGCGLTFGFSDSAIDHQADVLADHHAAAVADALVPVREAINGRVTKSLPTSDWALDPLPSCPNYAHVNPDWARALIAEARAVRAVLAAEGCES